MFIGGYIAMSIITIVAVPLNAFALVTLVYCYKKEELNLRNTLLLSITCSDILVSLVGFSVQIFFEDYDSCIVGGYIISSFSLVSMVHMVMLSIERLLSIKYPFRVASLFVKKRVVTLFVATCWLYGLMWGTFFPLLGWGGYIYESVEAHRCSIDIISMDVTSETYIYCLLFFCYVLPIIGTVCCFLIIRKELKKMAKNASMLQGKDSRSAQKTMKQQRSLALIVLLMLTCFLSTWTPYALCVFYRRTGGVITPTIFHACAYMGKTATIWNPIIYIFVYHTFRKAAVKMMPCLKKNRIIDVTTVHTTS